MAYLLLYKTIIFYGLKGRFYIDISFFFTKYKKTVILLVMKDEA